MTTLEDLIVTKLDANWNVGNRAKPTFERITDGNAERDVTNAEWLLVLEVKEDKKVATIDHEVYDDISTVKLDLRTRSDALIQSMKDEAILTLAQFITDISPYSLIYPMSIDWLNDRRIPLYRCIITCIAKVIG